MRTERSHTQRNFQIKRVAVLLAAAFLVTAVAISPARAKKHDQDDEDGGYKDDRHHEHKEHKKHWHEYPEHVYYPPPVVYAPQPFYLPPPPVIYAPPAPSINIVIPLPH